MDIAHTPGVHVKFSRTKFALLNYLCVSLSLSMILSMGVWVCAFGTRLIKL